jgi:Holliday junction resolvase RusA-like endonuclease
VIYGLHAFGGCGETYQLRVFGVPRPKGSWDIIPCARPIMHGAQKLYPIRAMRLKAQDSDHLKQWKHQVELAILEAGKPKTPVVGEVEVMCAFFMPRPKTVKRKEPTVAPDLDKLARAIGDMLTGVYYADDAQITRWLLSKCYATPEEGCDPGAMVQIDIKDSAQAEMETTNGE